MHHIADGRPYSLVDVSHRDVGFHCAGPAVVDALACACPQDPRFGTFPVDKCSRSVFARAQITLWRRSEHAFNVEIQRSYVAYVMKDIAHEMRGW